MAHNPVFTNPTSAVAGTVEPIVDGVLTLVPGPATSRGHMGFDALWMSTRDNEAGGGTSGTDTWTAGEVVNFTDPSFALEPGGTSGSFFSIINFDSFAGDSLVRVRGLSFVPEDITVGSTTTFDLLRGDVLFSTEDSETLTSTNTKSITSEDVVVFRPDSLGDYSSGTFTILLDSPFPGASIRAIHLVCCDITVGSTALKEGTFLLSRSGASVDQDLMEYDPTDVGEGTTSGTATLLFMGSDLGWTGSIQGVSLTEKPVVVGETPIAAGKLLITLQDNATVGSNSLSTQNEDIFIIEDIVTNPPVVNIDVGGGETGTPSGNPSFTPNIFYVDLLNTANASGTLTELRININSVGDGDLRIISLFRDQSDRWDVIDFQNLTITGTGIQTIPINLSINSGNYLGFWSSSVSVQRETQGSSQYHFLLTTQVPVVDDEYNETTQGGSSVRLMMEAYGFADSISGTATLLFDGSDVAIGPNSVHAFSLVDERILPEVIFGPTAVSPAAATALGETVDPTVATGSVLVTPAAATAIGVTIDPTVIEGAMAVTPAAATAIGKTVNPTVVLGSLSITPAEASAIGVTIDPTVLEVFAPASVIGTTVGPTVILGSMTVTPANASAIGVTVDPTVSDLATPATAIGVTLGPAVILSSITVTPAVATAIGAAAGPTVVLGALSLTPAAATAIGVTIDPTVIEGAMAVTPAAATAIGVTVDPTVVLGSMTATSAEASAIGVTIDPALVFGSTTAAPAAATAIGVTVDPTVIDPEAPATAKSTTVSPVVIFGSMIVVPAEASAIGVTIDPTVSDLATPATAIGETVDPTVLLGSLVMADMEATAIGSVAGPTVVLGSMTVTPPVASAIGAVVDPTVALGSTSVIPSAAEAFTATVDPVVLIGGSATAAPAPVTAIGVTIDPTTLVGSLTLSPLAASAIGTTVDPAVFTGSVVSVAAPSTAVGGNAGPLTEDPETPASAIGVTVAPVVLLGSVVLVIEPATAVGKTFVDLGPPPETINITLELFPDVFLQVIT